jgi:hypothetical protein
MPGSIRRRTDTPRQDAGLRVHVADPLAAHPEPLIGVSKHRTGPIAHAGHGVEVVSRRAPCRRSGQPAGATTSCSGHTLRWPWCPHRDRQRADPDGRRHGRWALVIAVIVPLILGLRRPVRRLTMAISLWAVIPVSCGWIALSTVVAQRSF